MAHSVVPEGSTEQNKALVRRFYAALDSGKLADAFALLTSDYLVHLPGSPKPGDREEYKRSAVEMYAAFPDLRHVIEDQVAEGDRVVVRLTARGTHQRPLGNMPATGRSMAVVETAIFRLAADRIAEQWPMVDTLGMLQQLGAMPRANERNQP